MIVIVINVLFFINSPAIVLIHIVIVCVAVIIIGIVVSRRVLLSSS